MPSHVKYNNYFIDAVEYDAMTEDCVSQLFEKMTRPWFDRLLPVIDQLFPDDFQDCRRTD